MYEKQIKNTITNPIIKFLENEFPRNLKKHLEPHISVDSSAGTYYMALFPSVKFIDRSLDGKFRLNLMYYFKNDMSGVYLILKIPYNNATKKKYGNDDYLDFLQKESDKFRAFLKENNKLQDDLVFNIDLAINRLRARAHDKATIVAKYYEKGNIPTTEELVDDINYFLDLRRFIVENYTNQTESSIDYNKDKFELSETEVADIVEDKSSFDSFYEYLIDLGYYFDKYTIENYLLSLKVKPFVILTGNSGTGKTKLSQIFAQYMRHIDNGDNEQYITFKTKSSYLNKDFGLGHKTVVALLGLEKYQGTLDFYFDDIKSTEYISVNTLAISRDQKLIKHLRTVDNLADIEIKINQEDLNNTFLHNESKNNILTFERKRGMKDFWSLPRREVENFAHIKHKWLWRAIVDGIETTIEFWIHDAIFSIENSENDQLKEYIGQKSENDFIKFKVDFSTFKQVTFHSDLGVEFLDDFKTVNRDNSNYKIIPVGANWTENRHIVGYYNVITNEYQSTPAYDLIKQANNSGEPHFLILDEMNLSHVERYFADFLSAIESGEKIPLYGDEEITLPQNLFIIGTVNVDETTYMFSPKVLDRANVLEFETYSSKDYMLGRFNKEAPNGNIAYLENPLLGNEIREYGIDELHDLFLDVTAENRFLWPILSEEISKFQGILKKSGFDFGFRVINEIIRFMAVAWEYEGKPSEFTNWNRYFDACIKQKILPKLHGSEKIIGETLGELYKLCTYGTESDLVKYPESYKKLTEMRTILSKQRYMSFIN